MARMVATKAALSIRFDALTNADEKSEPTATSIGTDNRAKLESRLRALEHEIEGGVVRRFGDNGKKQQRFQMTGETKTYNTQADHVDLVSTQRDDPMEAAVKAVLDVKEEKRRAKEERRAKKRVEKEKEKSSEPEGDDSDTMEVDGIDKGKGKKKRKRRESGQETEDVVMEEIPAEEPKASLPSFFLNTEFRLSILVSSGNRRGEKSKKKGS
jgi:nucleolar protein 58